MKKYKFTILIAILVLLFTVKITKPNMGLSPDEIFEKVNEGLLFPSKTTRHVFDMVFDTVRVELKTLKE